MAIYRLYNHAQPTTAAFPGVTTGTALKTMLQLKSKAGVDIKIKAWGISFDGSAAATPGKVELIETGTVAATVTATASTDVVKTTNPDGPAADTGLIALGTTSTGFTASAEGTVTASELFDAQYIAPTNQYIYQWPLGTEPTLKSENILRIRVHFGAAVNAVCWIDFEG